MNTLKQLIVEENPELDLCYSGDFRIKEQYTEKYEIIDFHCHLFSGLSELFPQALNKEKKNMDVSLFSKSCFPFATELFSMNEIYYTKVPTTLRSLNGIKMKLKLIRGAFALKYATSERLLHDMKLNHIQRAVVHQINPPNRNTALKMESILKQYPNFITFGSIHPFDQDISKKINHYLSLNIKGWKLNPHVWGVPIDCNETITLLKKLVATGLPILSCSGRGLPKHLLETKIPSKNTKKNENTQKIKQFYKVLDAIPDATIILAHAGCYDFEDIIELMLKYKNTYTDISVQPPQNIKRLIQEIGSERILFGTDYPFVNQAFSILSVLRATENDVERNNILSLNAKKLLNIE